MKATEGDFTINNQVDKYNNQQIAGGFSTEELLKSFQTDTKDTEIIAKLLLTPEFIEIFRE